VELHRAGPLPQARIRGVQSGIGEVLRVPERCRSVSVDGDGQFQTTLGRVRKHLRESKATRTLVGAVNDTSALGALRAYEEAARAG
jgi:ribose transport system substrate-binding protein